MLSKIAGSQYNYESIIVYLPGTNLVSDSGSVPITCGEVPSLTSWVYVLKLNLTLYYK